MTEKETMVPVSVAELAALKAMAILSDCRVIDFRTILSRIDERAGDNSKSLIGLMSLAYVIFEYKKRGREEAAQKIFDELKPEITPSVVELLDVLEEEWRGNNK